MCPTFVDTEMVRSNPKVIKGVRSYVGIMTVEKVVNDFVKLFEDLHSNKVNNGAIMLITPDIESQYVSFPKLISKL